MKGPAGADIEKKRGGLLVITHCQLDPLSLHQQHKDFPLVDLSSNNIWIFKSVSSIKPSMQSQTMSSGSQSRYTRALIS